MWPSPMSQVMDTAGKRAATRKVRPGALSLIIHDLEMPIRAHRHAWPTFARSASSSCAISRLSASSNRTLASSVATRHVALASPS